jgi:sugar phosphate isomerase/epimerase
MTDLVACYWTVSGPVEIHFGREWSHFDWQDRCDQAAQVGFTGLGLWHSDIRHQLEGDRTLAQMQEIFAAAGLRHLELEFIADFFVDPGTAERQASDATKALLFEAAATFGAHHIKVGNIPGAVCAPDRLAAAFARLCAEASEHTDAKIAYEFMPFDVNVNTLESALALMKDAGEPANAGLVIDTWHMAKLGISPDDFRRVRPEQLAWVELSDGHHHNLDDAIYEVTCDRNLPGEGEFDIRGYVEAFQQIGYPGPWGVEVLSAPLRELPIEQAFKRAYETTSAQFGAGVA